METAVQSPVESVADGSAPRRQLKVAIPATFVDVSIVGETLRAFRAVLSGEPAGDNLDLGMIEALNNVVEHAYEAGTEGFVEIVYEEYGNRLMVEIIDRGRPMPARLMDKPAARSLQPDTPDIGDLDEGGRGVLLIKALFDAIEYTRVGNENRLRLTKTLSSPATARKT